MSGTPTDSPALAPDGDDAFNAALVELENTGTDAPAAAAGDDGNTPEAPPATGAASSEQAGDHGQAAGDQAPAGAPTDDVWKDVPEAARAQFDKLQRDFMAASGRLSAADRRANQLAQQLQQSSGVNGTQAPADGSQPATPASAKALLESDSMKRLKDEYPEIAGPITETLSAIAQQMESMAAPVQALNEQHVHQEVQARYNALAERHPDWQQLATDARWPNFLAQAPDYVRQMHARNVDVSDPEEAADVLGRFKEFIGVTATPTPTPSPTPTPAADRRQRQLDAGRDGGSNGAGAAGTGIPDDFDAAVAAYASKADAQSIRPIR